MSDSRTLLALARQSLGEPRHAAANLMALEVPMAAVWPAFFLVNILTVILGQLIGAGQTPPLLVAGFTIAFGLVSVVLIHRIGGAFGGIGTFDDTLMLTTFLQTLFLAGQAAQVALLVVLPPLAGVFGIALLFFVAWLNINFIAALHGFSSLWRALAVLLAASFILAVIVMFVLSATGQLPEAPPA